MFRICVERHGRREWEPLQFRERCAAMWHAKELAAAIGADKEAAALGADEEAWIRVLDSQSAEVACFTPLSWRAIVRMSGDKAYAAQC